MFSSFFERNTKKKIDQQTKKQSSSSSVRLTNSSSSKKFKSKKKRKSGKVAKRKREEEVEETRKTETTKRKSQKTKGIPFHPFKSQFGDHFSTSDIALRDFVPVLRCLCDYDDKKKNSTKIYTIYDPFYCDGSVKQRLNDLGFPDVIHENRDFYEDVKSNRVPDHDILVTNPPYSSTHKIRILEYALTQNSKRPFALLLPSYVVSKQWYKNAIRKHLSSHAEQPFFVVPKTRYEYEHPTGKGHESSPFESLWIVCAWERTEKLYSRSKHIVERENEATMYRTPIELEKGGVIKLSRKRPNPRARRKKRKK